MSNNNSPACMLQENWILQKKVSEKPKNSPKLLLYALTVFWACLNEKIEITNWFFEASLEEKSKRSSIEIQTCHNSKQELKKTTETIKILNFKYWKSTNYQKKL